MKRISSLLIFATLLTLVSASSIKAQSCPTGQQDCYTYATLSGSDLTSSNQFEAAPFNILVDTWCPLGRVKCSETVTVTVRISRVQGTGTIMAPGVPTTSASMADAQFVKGVCSGGQNFFVVLTRTGLGQAEWLVEVEAVSGGGVICNSGSYLVTLQP